MYDIDEKKTKYFVIGIILLIILGIFLIVHFNNRSLVSGDEQSSDETTTVTTTSITTISTTTKKVRTTTKRQEKEEVVNVSNEVIEKVIYKSTIDDNYKFIYNYKLTDEIKDDYKLIATKLELNQYYIDNNIIGLYDISLFDSNMIKQSVNNSLISIKIPLNGDLIGYDEYKVVFIDDNNSISNEIIEAKIENNYIVFDTNHLSKYGVVGIKNKVKEEIKEEEKELEEKVDLTNVSIDMLVNEEKIDISKEILLSTSDKLNIVVNNLDKEYEVYYAIKSIDENIEYNLFNDGIFSNIVTPSNYTLLIKIVVGNEFKIFELNVDIYDIVYKYDANKELEKSESIGVIESDTDTEYDYKDKEINNNIVIDNITVVDETIEEDLKKEDNENIEENLDQDNSNDLEQEEILDENSAVVSLYGNIYVVEETDLSKLEMTGYLIIDTDQNITFKYDEFNKIDISNLYSIEIKSKEFIINGIKYTYEFVEENLVIKRFIDDVENIVDNEEFENLFDEVDLNKNENNELVIIKKEQIENDILKDSVYIEE